VVAFHNQRGTAEQWIREGKNAVTWTRLSCRRFAANAARLQLHALAYNLGNFLRTLVLPDEAKLCLRPSWRRPSGGPAKASPGSDTWSSTAGWPC
jgi:hypothetical protein